MDAIRTGAREPADGGRLQCKKEFQFNSVWNGTRYATKRVNPIFVDEAAEIVVITVYTYYY